MAATTANRLVLIGFVPLIVSLLLSLVVLARARRRTTWIRPGCRPSRRSWAARPRIWLGGILAYGISTLLNVTIFSRLKASEGAACCGCAPPWPACSARSSTRLIFITVAFYGVFPIGELILGQMLAKVVLSIVLVPPLIYLFVALGRRLDSPLRGRVADTKGTWAAGDATLPSS